MKEETRIERKEMPTSRPIPRPVPVRIRDYEMTSLAEKKKEDLIVNISVLFIILSVIAGGLYAAYTFLPSGGF